MVGHMRSRVFLLAPLLLFLAAAYLIPFLGIMTMSVTEPVLGLQQYQTAVSDDLVLRVFWRTMRICVIVTVVSVAIAYVLTLLWVRGNRLTSLLVRTLYHDPVLDFGSQPCLWLAVAVFQPGSSEHLACECRSDFRTADAGAQRVRRDRRHGAFSGAIRRVPPGQRHAIGR